jgi:hypothetical protein
MRRRIANPLFMAEALTVFASFVAVLSIRNAGGAAFVTCITMIVLLVADTYRGNAQPSPWRLLAAVAAAIGTAWLGNALANGAGVSWRLPFELMSRASTLTFLVLTWIRFAHVFRRANQCLDHPIPDALPELQIQARRFEDSIRRRNLFVYAMSALMAGVFSRMALVTTEAHSLGAWLIVAGVGGLAYQISQFPPRIVPQEADYGGSMRFYHGELVRQRAYHSGMHLALRIGALLPGGILLSLGLLWEHPDSMPRAVVRIALFVALAVLAVRLNDQVARRYDRQIARIEDK